MADPLTKYLQQYLSAGYDTTVLKNFLIQKGYQAAQVDAAMVAAKATAVPKAKYAGFGLRMLALFLDVLIVSPISFAVGFIGGLLFYDPSSSGAPIGITIGWSVLLAVIYTLLEGIVGGSPGKLFLGLRTVDDKGNYIGIPKAFLRLVVRFISTYALFIGYFMILLNDKKQSLHDKAAHSYVVVREEHGMKKHWKTFATVMAVGVVIIGVLIGFTANQVISFDEEVTTWQETAESRFNLASSGDYDAFMAECVTDSPVLSMCQPTVLAAKMERNEEVTQDECEKIEMVDEAPNAIVQSFYAGLENGLKRAQRDCMQYAATWKHPAAPVEEPTTKPRVIPAPPRPDKPLYIPPILKSTPTQVTPTPVVAENVTKDAVELNESDINESEEIEEESEEEPEEEGEEVAEEPEEEVVEEPEDEEQPEEAPEAPEPDAPEEEASEEQPEEDVPEDIPEEQPEEEPDVPEENVTQPPEENVTEPEPEEPGITFDEIVAEDIPQEWIDQFDADFEIEFTVSGAYEFSESDKAAIMNGTYKSVYIVDRLDSYFTKPLPWTEGKRYYAWLTDTISGIRFSPDPNSVAYCCMNDMITLKGLQMRDNYRNGWLDTWYDPQSGMGAYTAGASIITHEARHNNGLNHADCNGFTNMDSTLQMVGSHGANYMFVFWMENMLSRDMVDEVKAAYGHEYMFSGSSYISRMCTYNESAQGLDDEDATWLESCLTGDCVPT